MDDSLKMGAKTFSVLYKCCYFLSIHTLTSHVLLSLLISLNRCTAVGWPTRHSELWSTRRTMIAITVVQFLMVPTYMPILWSSEPVRVAENGELVFIDLDPTMLSRIHLIGTAFFVSRSIVCLLMSIYTLRKLLQLASIQSHTSAGVSDSERKLCLHAIILFGGSLIMMVEQLVMFYAASTLNLALALWMAKQYPWMHDVVIYTNLYSIIICSSHVRSLFGTWTTKPRVELSVSGTAPRASLTKLS